MMRSMSNEFWQHQLLHCQTVYDGKCGRPQRGIGQMRTGRGDTKRGHFLQTTSKWFYSILQLEIIFMSSTKPCYKGIANASHQMVLIVRLYLHKDPGYIMLIIFSGRQKLCNWLFSPPWLVTAGGKTWEVSSQWFRPLCLCPSHH